MTKAELRKIYTGKREALSEEDYALLNQQLLNQFITLDLTAIKCLHVFLTIKSRKEPDTKPIINWLKKSHPQIKIVFPKTNFADHSMQSFINDEALQLAENSSGILEPVSGNIIDDTEIDLIVVPLLAFDERGYRVGYGKGFYDRFIDKCRADVQLVGLSFFNPVHKIADVDGFDKQMQKCLTPDNILNF